MDARALKVLGWLARREASRLKVRGIVGAALLALGIGLWLAVVRPTALEIDAVRAEVADLRTRLRSGGDDGGRAVPGDAAQLENFYGFFPRTDSLPDWLGHIHNAAMDNGLVLESGEYRLQQPKDARLARYQVMLPVRGTYPQLRGFVADVLERVPAAGLEDVVVKRDAIGNPTLDAQLKFVIYLSGGRS
jgi:Tfp pilus assembly protein PilO